MRRGTAAGGSDGRDGEPAAAPPSIVEQATVMAMRLPGFGNPLSLRVDVFDGAMAALSDAHDEVPAATPREAVERDMRRIFG